MTIRQEIEFEHIVAEICDNVCKYRESLVGEDLSARCELCAMERLFKFCNTLAGGKKK